MIKKMICYFFGCTPKPPNSMEGDNIHYCERCGEEIVNKTVEKNGE